MPGTTRYSATFDRTYEEEENEHPAEAPVSRRSRSQSWQCQTSTESRRYRPLDSLRHARSPSAEKGQTAAKGAEVIPTRNVGKASVKAHNNPFQFVKVNTAPLHHKAEEQLKKLQEVKKPPVVKEDEEEWQMNLDGWKSRRRKMSETAIRRQEELRQFETEDPSPVQNSQKKTKTFSEMVEQRAHRGRALSLCLFSNPLETSDWIFEANKSRSNGMRSQDPLSGESAESSTLNSEDDNESYTKHDDDDKNNYNCVNNNSKPRLTNGHSIENSASNSSISKSSELSEYEASQGCLTGKDRNCNGGYIDSGLESLSSSHRTGDIPDSGSDFSHDSGSSLDCDSPRVSALITTGIELLEEFSSKDEDLFSVNANCQKQVPMKESVASPVNNVVQPTIPLSIKKSSEVNKVKTKKVLKKETGSKKASIKPSQCESEEKNSVPKVSSSTAKSVESENEMFVDDFEELARLKNANGAIEKLNGEIKVNNVSSPDALFVDPINHPLNIIYKSGIDGISSAAPLQNAKVNSNSSSKSSPKPFSLITEVPVEKITEEMERLILEQLEEEEKVKEAALAEEKRTFVDDKNDLAPVKHIEPPKEKPPPPPSSSPPSAPSKEGPLKRVNSTKRIIKEIHKRRSDFLGIDKTAEDSMHSETSVPPPPVLEDLLRAEREQDRLRRQMLASKIPNKSLSEEIAKKEQEIIDNLETEERQRQEQEVPSNPSDIQAIEEERINKLKEERKQIEEERLIAEEQKARLEEARLLQKREEYIRKQEVDGNKGPTLSSLSPSIDAPSTNPVTVLPTVEEGGSLPSQNGDGPNNKAIASSPSVTDVRKTKESPPATLPKPPLKKKEAIRKERERLRQEQEALQREREEHRLKIQKEQEQLKKNVQSSHVPPPVDPPIPAMPTQPPRLTNSSLITSVQLQGDSYNGSNLGGRDTNGNQTTGAQCVTGRQCRSAVARTKARVQQKVPCVRKQTEPTTEGRYNQNHWLIQEAEMRRIAEQKERQRSNAPVDARFIAANQVAYHQPPIYSEEYRQTLPQRPSNLPIAQSSSVNSSNYAVPAQLYSPDQHWTFPAQSGVPSRNINPSSVPTMGKDITYSRPSDHGVSGPIKPVKGTPLEKQEQMLSVSGRKRCSHCGEELGRGAAMIIESLQLYYHIHCFQCCVCQAQLGNGSCGTDVRVRNNKLHCHNCYSNDEAGLKFSQV